MVEGEIHFYTPPSIFYGITIHYLKSRRPFNNLEVSSMQTSAEQATVPTCGVCGRKLGVGFYYSCHTCGASYCYAHSPTKCNHAKARQAAGKSPLVR